MNQAQYAKHLGISKQAVGKLVKLGKIPVGKNGQINPIEADKILRGNQDPSRDHLRRSKPKGNGLPLPDSPKMPPPAQPVTWQDARTQKEKYQALMAKLEFEEKIGNLVRIDQVRRELSEMNKMTRDRILGTARRLAPLLVGRSVENEIADTIYQELEDALRSLNDNRV